MIHDAFQGALTWLTWMATLALAVAMIVVAGAVVFWLGQWLFVAAIVVSEKIGAYRRRNG